MTVLVRPTVLLAGSKRLLQQSVPRPNIATSKQRPCYYSSNQNATIPMELMMMQQQQQHKAQQTAAAASIGYGSMFGAVAFVSTLVGANCLAIWCEVHNPNHSYLQDLGSLRRRRQQSPILNDDAEGKALVEFDEGDFSLASMPPDFVHPRYEKRLATKLIHVQLKGW